MKNFLKGAAFVLIVVLAVTCREKYVPPVIVAANDNYIVVEGYINVGQGATVFNLSHTRSLDDSTPVLPLTGANVAVESDDGNSYTLADYGDGSYQTPFIPASGTAKYRLAITTPAGKQFVSDYVETKQSPLIDSVSWEQQNDGVHIYANTHDDAGKTRYYKWDYVETYEYHAPFDSYFQVENGFIVQRPYEQHIWKCWRTTNSSQIYIASTAKLARDEVYKDPLVFIPASTQKIGVLYSVLVKQYALTEQAYDYWQTVSKNTENLGTLFDPQPSQVEGNIHCINDASAIALGFVSASTVQQQRIFISKLQLNNWQYPPDPLTICDTVHLNNDNMSHYLDAGYVPVDYYTQFAYYATLPDCADCRRQGGTTDKPPFWP